MQTNVVTTYRHTLADLGPATLTFNATDRKVFSVALAFNGKMYNWHPGALSDTLFTEKDPAHVASLFDPFGSVRNAVDGKAVVAYALQTINDKGLDSSLEAQAISLSTAFNMTSLFAGHNQFMTTVFGYDWVDTETRNLVGKTKDWLDLVAAVTEFQSQLRSLS